MSTYLEREVRAACELIYGQTIAPRTWRKWKAIALIPKRRDELNRQQALNLMTLAFLKHESPYKAFTRQDIKAQLEQHPEVEAFTTALDKAWEHIKENGVPGRDVPAILHMLTHRRVSERTIRRWEERSRRQFSRDRLYYAHEIQQWCDRLCNRAECAA